MIDKHELRIGNKVSLVNESNNPIVTIESLQIKSVWLTEMGSTIWTYEDLLPIELTSELLLKFGFVRENNGWNINKPTSYTEPYFSLFDDNLCNGELNLKLNGSDMLLPEVKHAHHLQNLYFALTGEELTIL